MHRTEGTDHALNLFKNGPPGTVVEENWLNAIQEEICNVIEGAGIVLKTAETETRNQLASLLPTVNGAKAFDNTGLHILDTNASHDLIIKAGSDLTVDRILTLTTGDAARGLTISASGTVMIGDGGTTKAWFYQNVAPTGWTVDATPADAVLAVKGGANAYNANGGTQAGTWTQPNHTHTGPSHTHTGPNHAHTGTTSTVAGALAGVELNPNGATYGHDHTFSTSYAGTEATGAEGTGATGSSGTGATYRPLAQLGIICTLNAA